VAEKLGEKRNEENGWTGRYGKRTNGRKEVGIVWNSKKKR